MSAIEQALRDVAGSAGEPARARTLPGPLYYDPEVFAREIAAIFQRSWQYAGHVSQLSEPGAGLVQQIGDERVIVRRDGAGALRAARDGGWGEGIDAGAAPVRVEALCGFVFFNLDAGADALCEQAAGFDAEFRSFCPAPEALRPAYREEIEVKANWKNIIENYCECYHCPVAHKSLATTGFNMDSYRIAVHPAYHHHSSEDAGASQAYDSGDDSGPRGHEFGGWYLWPNVCFEFYPGGRLTVFHNLPVAPERTLQAIEWFLPEATPSAVERDIIAFVDIVRREDVPIVESVQRGLHSRGYRPGRLIVDDDAPGLSEHAVHAFQAKVLRALGAPGAAP